MLENFDFNWDILDFTIAGIILTIVFLTIRYVLKKLKNHPYKNYILVIIIILFFLLWAEMAVGIFGSPIAGN